MKNIAIKEHHLYNKAYKKGNSYIGRLVTVYVLKDYTAERLRRENPEKEYVNRIGLAVSKKLGARALTHFSKFLGHRAFVR